MKFFAALIAKLTGTAEAPKTLDQARATFGEAKAALDKVAAMFTAASLDFDALLAKGAAALKDYISGLNAKVTSAETALAEATAKVTATEAKLASAEAQVAAHSSQLTAHSSLFASIGFKLPEVKGTGEASATPEQQTAAFQSVFNAHIANGVTAKMAELGVKADKLPAAANASDNPTEAELHEQLSATSDPVEKGLIVAKLKKLRAASWGKN